MAAPSNAYASKKTVIRKSGVNYDHYIAKIHVDEATHKAMFYLDDLVSMQIDGQEVWLGVVFSTSPNYQMHNIARHGIGRYKGGIILNDAGLNTLAPVNLGANGFITLFANYLRAHILVKSARYVDTTSWGFEFKKPADPNWTRVALSNPTAIPQNSTLNQNWRLPAGFEPETTYQIRFYNINAEGTYISSPATTLTTGVYVLEEQFQQRTAACTTTTNEVILFIPTATRAAMSLLTNTAVTADLFAWTGDNFDTEPAQGWYFSHDDGYSYFYDSNFGFTHRTFCEIVPTIKINVNVTVFEAGYWTATANNITGTNFTVPITITLSAVGKNGGVPAGDISISVTIPANQGTGMSSGPHSVDYIDQLDWELGGFVSSNHSLVLNNEINGLVGLG